MSRLVSWLKHVDQPRGTVQKLSGQSGPSSVTEKLFRRNGWNMMKHDENTKQRKKWLTIYVTSIHCQYTNWWNFHVNGSEFSPINKIEQGSLATTSMITTATKLMDHFMLDCSSKEVSPSHSKSSAPANASINASVTTKNSLRSACMARLLKSTTNVWIYSSKTNKVNSF